MQLHGRLPGLPDEAGLAEVLPVGQEDRMTAKRGPGKLSPQEAGGIGGRLVAARYSRAHFRRIGRMGGQAGGRPRLRTFDEIAGEPRGRALLREFQTEFRRWLSTESNS